MLEAAGGSLSPLCTEVIRRLPRCPDAFSAAPQRVSLKPRTHGASKHLPAERTFTARTKATSALYRIDARPSNRRSANDAQFMHINRIILVASAYLVHIIAIEAGSESNPCRLRSVHSVQKNQFT
jgi:hypothetical protein